MSLKGVGKKGTDLSNSGNEQNRFCSYSIFVPILLLGRIGKRSPEWWWLKDKERKNP